MMAVVNCVSSLCESAQISNREQATQMLGKIEELEGGSKLLETENFWRSNRLSIATQVPAIL